MPCSYEPVVTFEEGKIILVTGASSGIGSAIALRCNALGATVIASGRSRAKLEAVRAEVLYPERFHVEPKDFVADIETLARWVGELRERHGKFGGFAFAAGRTETMPFMQYERATALELFDLLCHIPLLLARAVLDRRNCVSGDSNAGGFSAVFIAAAASIAPNKGQTVYGAAKAALVCAARCMSKELAQRGIRVNCISPGLVKTPMLEETTAFLGEEFLQTEGSLYPLGLGLPEDVGNLAAFLLSPAARWITGQNILIDGGRLA
ncbi:SDR family oxidoreductase [Desulfovibrio sp. OttesenSCG-928-F20]|nr:SDR family oxidoreductase [Desulfovibrio sp. OttesenSCG-928-M16]MDL2291242.1 SDR family oxidoreductase [Desulfovibrio sp. OttesenSCG-928-F20]